MYQTCVDTCCELEQFGTALWRASRAQRERERASYLPIQWVRSRLDYTFPERIFFFRWVGLAASSTATLPVRHRLCWPSALVVAILSPDRPDTIYSTRKWRVWSSLRPPRLGASRSPAPLWRSPVYRRPRLRPDCQLRVAAPVPRESRQQQQRHLARAQARARPARPTRRLRSKGGYRLTPIRRSQP